MFRGRYDTAVDDKGRTSLPFRYREVLASVDDDRFVVTTGLDPCLVAYPLSGWRDFEKRLSSKPSFDPSVVMLKRVYVSSAVECPVDGHGRILLPQNLRDYAGITRKVVWGGMVGYVELWDEGRFREIFAAAQAGATGLGKALADLGL
jgi:MraZ protein